MFSDASRNAMITAEPTTHLSLHSAFSAVGGNELSGGSPAYARRAVSYGAASAGVKATSANVVFDVPAGATVRFVGRWTALTGGTFLGMDALNGTEMEFSVDLTTDTVKAPAHGLANTDQIVFIGGTPPGGLVEGTVYFVRDAATDTFKVAGTSGGVAIDLTSEPSARCVVSKVVPETYGAQGTFTVNAGSSLGASV